MNKTPRQSEGSVSLEYIISVEYLIREAMSWVGWRNFIIQWCRGGLRVAEKVSIPIRETNIPSILSCYNKGVMKKEYMRVKRTGRDYSTRLFRAEANVDMKIESTRPMMQIKGVEVIDGVKYYVLKV